MPEPYVAVCLIQLLCHAAAVPTSLLTKHLKSGFMFTCLLWGRAKAHVLFVALSYLDPPRALISAHAVRPHTRLPFFLVIPCTYSLFLSTSARLHRSKQLLLFSQDRGSAFLTLGVTRLRGFFIPVFQCFRLIFLSGYFAHDERAGVSLLLVHYQVLLYGTS